MRVINFGGAVYVRTEKHNFLFGSFSEIHKNIMKVGLPFPDVVIISDVISQEGIPQLVPEFLFFGYLFIEKKFDFDTSIISQLLTFIGTPSQCKRVERILEVSYCGCSANVLKARAKLPKNLCESLRKEGDYFALKDKTGKVIPTKDFINFLNWENNKICIYDTLIEKIGPIQFKITNKNETKDIILDLTKKPEPVWKLPDVFGVKDTHLFSLCILGGAEPWYPDAPSTSYLLTLNGQYYLIDCAPFTHKILEKLGIGIEQIKGIIISHIHDDHSGDLLTFAQASRKIEIITTREIWESIRIKLACIMDQHESQIAKYFSFREVKVDTRLYLAGATLDFHYACHSVPTIGFTIKSNSDSITITSDTASKKMLDEMLKNEIITQERYSTLDALVTKGKVIVDCGESLIHGYLDELLRLENTEQILCTHRHDLPTEYKGVLTLAEPFQIFKLGTPDQDILDTVTICHALQSMNIEDFWAWGSFFALNKNIMEFPENTVIIKEGSSKKDYFYIVTYGFLNVIINNEKVSRLQGGNFFGEQIFLNDNNIRNATICSITPVRLIGIPNKCFEAMLYEEDQKLTQKKLESLTDRLLRLWKNREVVSCMKIFSNLDTGTLNKLSLHLIRMEFPPNTTVIKEGSCDDKSCYLVEKGTLEVRLSKSEHPVILKENDIFGEAVACGFIEVRSATVKTLETCNLLKISNNDLRSLSHNSPQILQALEKLINKRHYSL